MDPLRKKSIELEGLKSLDEGSVSNFYEIDTIPEMEPKAVDAGLNTNFQILVVEDSPLNQLLMKVLLRDFGFNCTIAQNGKMAINELENDGYDLILMDLQMPEMDGFEVTKYIREKMKLNVPIIALTADVTSVDLLQCKALGMNDYLPKPLDDQLLRRKIIELVKKHSTSNKNETNETPILIHSTYCNLESLTKRTKYKPKLMTEMILLYLEQTPILVKSINESLIAQNWKSLNAAVHKLIPSFAIMGIHQDYENLARKIEEYTKENKHLDELPELIVQLESICSKACEELKEVVKKRL